MSPSQREPLARPAARLLLLTPQGSILLFRSRARSGGPLWFPPGGGLEPGESYEQAALRELAEETGLQLSAPGPCVWTREHVWQGDRLYRSLERYYRLQIPGPFDPKPQAIGAFESYMREPGWWRWWRAHEIAAAPLDHVFAPRRLAELLPGLLSGELPAEPIDAGE